MSYYQYYLTPKPGYTLEEACEEASERTAFIEEFRGGEPTGMFFLCTSGNKQKLDPKFPSVYYARKQKIVQRGHISTLEKPLFEDKLANKANPFFQLIVAAVSRSEKPSEGIFGLTTEGIVRHLINDIRIFPNTKDSVKIVHGLIYHMNKQSLILHKGDRWSRGLILKGGDMTIDWKQGYNPIMYQIVGFVKGTGMTAREEIYDYVMNYLGWLNKKSVLDNYLKVLVKTNVLTVQHNNWYIFKNPLVSYVAERDKESPYPK